METKPLDELIREELYSALNIIRHDVLASHLIIMEEIRTLQEDMFDPEAEVRRFLDLRKSAAAALNLEEKSALESLSLVLARRQKNQKEP